MWCASNSYIDINIDIDIYPIIYQDPIIYEENDDEIKMNIQC